MLMYAIFAEKLAFKDDTFLRKDHFKRIIDGVRPTIPSSCSEEIRKLIELGWNKVPSKRPSFVQIESTLRFFYQQRRFGKEGAKARQTAEKLLKDMPQLETEENLQWTLGSGKEFEQLCELLKTNAIPTKNIELKSMVTNCTR